MSLTSVASADAADLVVSIPPDLHRFGRETKARIVGKPGAPMVVALGGISANRFVAEGPEGDPGWWSGLIGPGAAISPASYRILGYDFAADESGRAAPSTLDQARILSACLDAAGCEKATMIGASYGGMVALKFAELWPQRVAKLVAISAPAAPHPTASAVRELQRRVVALGTETGREDEALGIARGMAMLTYRTPTEFAQRFRGGIESEDPISVSKAGAYLRARGVAYRSVMSPQRFLSLSASIDRHQVDASKIGTPTLVIGASSDQLVPPQQLEEMAAALPNAQLHLLDCLYGHDMFLKEAQKVGLLISRFLDTPT